MTTEELNKIRDEAADKYRDNDFNENPNGYTVSPYVNRETTWEAYATGFDKAVEVMRGEVERLQVENNNLKINAEEYISFKLTNALDKYKQIAEKLADVLKECSPSWLPVGIRAMKREALNHYEEMKERE